MNAINCYDRSASGIKISKCYGYNCQMESVSKILDSIDYHTVLESEQNLIKYLFSKHFASKIIN